MCTDTVDVRQDGNYQIGHNRLAIIPQLNFTCNEQLHCCLLLNTKL